MTICNPLLGMPGMNTMNNPFAMWQDMWAQGLKAVQPLPHMQPQAAASMPQPLDMLQQWQAMWLQGINAFTPQGAVPAGMGGAMQAPKVTVTTIELGDMRPYMEMASQMMQAWQPMLNGMMSQTMMGGRR